MDLTPPSKQDEEIMRELIHQVSKAVPRNRKHGASEVNVMTCISLDMWKAWCRAVGDPEDSDPSEWRLKDCHRVYGSLTVIVPGDGMFSWSSAI